MNNDQVFNKILKYVTENYCLDEKYEIPTYTDGDKIVALMPSNNVISVAFNADGIFGVGKFGFVDIINNNTKADEIYYSVKKTNSLYMITGDTGNLHIHNNEIVFTNYPFRDYLKVENNPFWDYDFSRFNTQAIIRIKKQKNKVIVSDWDDKNLFSEEIYDVSSAINHREYSNKLANMYYDVKVNPNTFEIEPGFSKIKKPKNVQL